MDQLGVTDVLAVTAILSGQPFLPTRGKPMGATRGTSPASALSRHLIRYQLKGRGLPMLTGSAPHKMRLSTTRHLGAWVGRSIPIVGWLVIATDAVQIGWDTVIEYNKIAAPEDRLTL